MKCKLTILDLRSNTMSSCYILRVNGHLSFYNNSVSNAANLTADEEKELLSQVNDANGKAGYSKYSLLPAK